MLSNIFVGEVFIKSWISYSGKFWRTNFSPSGAWCSIFCIIIDLLAKKKDIRSQLDGKQAELAKLAEELKLMELNAGKKLIAEMAPRLERAVKQVVKEKKIDMLFDKQMVVYTSPSHDVTADVIKRLNQ